MLEEAAIKSTLVPGFSKARLDGASVSEETSPEFEKIFQDYWPRIFAVLTRLVGDPQEAEDLALETFLRLYQKPPPRQEPDKLGGWLFRVATNLGYNALRAQQRRQTYEYQAGMEALAATRSADPASRALRLERQENVRQVLREMKPEWAKLLILRHSGLSYAEVAATLKMNPLSVGKQLSRAESDFARRYQALEGGKDEAF